MLRTFRGWHTRSDAAKVSQNGARARPSSRIRRYDWVWEHLPNFPDPPGKVATIMGMILYCFCVCCCEPRARPVDADGGSDDGAADDEDPEQPLVAEENARRRRKAVGRDA